jgi:hypothetical protein
MMDDGDALIDGRSMKDDGDASIDGRSNSLAGRIIAALVSGHEDESDFHPSGALRGALRELAHRARHNFASRI